MLKKGADSVWVATTKPAEDNDSNNCEKKTPEIKVNDTTKPKQVTSRVLNEVHTFLVFVHDAIFHTPIECENT